MAAIFVDHYSGLCYVHLHHSTTTAEIVEVKHHFEAYALRHGVRIQRYCIDNGRLMDKAFVRDVRKNGQ